MQKQKRGFWLFIFSLIPGAGEMYMGFKKQGISIMFLFWGVFAIGACTGMDWLVFLIPIIWFYSFFNVHNLKSLSEEEFFSIEDSYLLHMDELAGDISSLLKHHGKITAILLIFLGASILWNTLLIRTIRCPVMFFLSKAVRLFFIQCILLAGENINPCKNDSSCNHKLWQMICESADNISQISG